MVLGGESEAERRRRVHDVIRACIRRRVAGEPLPDEEIASDHPDLMPELGQGLQALALIQRAEEHASDTVNRADDRSADVTLPADSFPGYEITSEIHRGGQGVVYEALQKSTQRKVAIKAMKEGPFGRSGDRTRFEREVQILGQLKHPHIVTIHDSGSAAGGFYYVMDYIEGTALDEFMVGQERSIPETLELFTRVCDAVNAAHLHGIIHRDLKPSNVRVDPQEEPHILDFGLAKVATGEDERSGMTLTGQFVGSVPWASPEQAEGMPQKIDVRTDVYSLGMILYHMLTGSFPYEVTGNIRDVIDNILKAEPTRPSTIRRRIDDEVETIVLKCLSKEPQRRYQTAGELARDIRRYLAGEPIEAKRDSVGYVLRKHLRRYRIPVAIAGAFALVVTIGFFTSLMFWRDAVLERNAADASRAEAERQASIAEAVNEFLNKDLLAVASPYRTRDSEITVREALGIAAAAIENRFEDEPLVEAAIQATLGSTYGTLGEYEAAEPHLKRALKLRRTKLGYEHVATLESMRSLARLYMEQGRYADAEPLYIRTVELQQRVLGEDHPNTLTSMQNLAVLRARQGHHDEAEAAYLRVLELQRRVLGEDHHLTLSSTASLATLYNRQGRYKEAEPLFLRVLERQRHTLGNDHPSTLGTAGSLAELYRQQGRYDEAEVLLLKVVEGQRSVLGDEHSRTLLSINNLAHLYRDQGRYDEAEPLFAEAIETWGRTLGSDHPWTLAATTNLAVLYRKQGRYEDAEPLYLEVLEMERRVLGEEHPQTLSCLGSLGALYHYMARYDEAEPLLLEAVERYHRVLGEEHPQTFVPMATLAAVYHAQGRYDDAEDLNREALAGFRRTYGDNHRRTLSTQHSLASTLVALQKYEDAEPLARQLLILRRADPQVPSATIAKSLRLLADILLRSGKPEEAEPLLRECLEIRRASEAEDDRLIASTESLLGGCLTALGRYEEAELLLLESYPRIEVTGEEPDDLTRAACQRIIDLYETWGDPEKADEWRAKLPSPPDVSEPPAP